MTDLQSLHRALSEAETGSCELVYDSAAWTGRDDVRVFMVEMHDDQITLDCTPSMLDKYHTQI